MYNDAFSVWINSIPIAGEGGGGIGAHPVSTAARYRPGSAASLLQLLAVPGKILVCYYAISFCCWCFCAEIKEDVTVIFWCMPWLVAAHCTPVGRLCISIG